MAGGNCSYDSSVGRLDIQGLLDLAEFETGVGMAMEVEEAVLPRQWLEKIALVTRWV